MWGQRVSGVALLETQTVCESLYQVLHDEQQLLHTDTIQVHGEKLGGGLVDYGSV